MSNSLNSIILRFELDFNNDTMEIFRNMPEEWIVKKKVAVDH
ncbi:hypothetical protein Thit_1326 [Thermoanaerobacter italicus Ab9]|uniref:Uncharacterized protein n=1 Tax=Thermoanaerobacter italicus (strain DSM 9252 / Ab9) TaxID=580331 RepID=D3T2Y6_THEIA|nr:hypothetical protein [Thermoanaerobacter italicus]ADD02588.1 hypothetical protein Thit_1326 [Thermoanaerobacter italicus Ab9]